MFTYMASRSPATPLNRSIHRGSGYLTNSHPEMATAQPCWPLGNKLRRITLLTTYSSIHPSFWGYSSEQDKPKSLLLRSLHSSQEDGLTSNYNCPSDEVKAAV